MRENRAHYSDEFLWEHGVVEFAVGQRLWLMLTGTFFSIHRIYGVAIGDNDKS